MRIPQTSLANDNLADLLRLIRSENIGPVTFFQLIKRFGTAKAALAAIPDLAQRGGKRQINICSSDIIEKEINNTHKLGAKFVVYGQKEYPELLHYLHDAPPVLSILGNVHLLNNKPIMGMVGARNASASGCAFARKIAHELGEQGYIVASGLARGIDAYAHSGALTTGTIASIAGGIDNVYPPENAKLRAQIIELGVIISENPFGSTPLARHFPARNRIISGVSRGILVVEASPKSGSLITAEFALEQGREVFAVPGSPLDPRAQGCNKLIKQGAVLVQSIHDIMDGLSTNFSLADSDNGQFYAANLATISENAISEADIIKAHKLIDEKLGASPVSIDELQSQTDLSISLIMSCLLEKEIAGTVQRHLGNKISKNYDI